MASGFDFKTVEEEVSSFWNANQIYKKVKLKNSSGPWFYFLDGPPYTNGSVHLGTAWNKSLKDALLRFKRMNGFNVFDRAGWDMHGLPIEHAVEKKFGLKSKNDVEQFGVDRFIKECKAFALENLEKMRKDFEKLGVWMDFDNAYKSMDRDFISNEWWLIKQVHDQGRLYEAFKTMHWCSRCATALAKHELEYKTVEETSIFVKFKVKNSENKYLIIWTTTPWTLAFNLAVMANPELEYIEALVDNEVWILAKALASSLIQGVVGKNFKVLKTFKGSELEGLAYEHPFNLKVFEELKSKHERVHTVVLSSEYVTATAGSGLVHCAPGCGPEDYEVGLKYGLPAFNNIDERGVFPESMQQFAGLRAKVDDKAFIEELKKVGALIAETAVQHEYAHCWRCKQPVIFRTTKQWFFKVEDLKEEILKLNKQIRWIPSWAGERSFASWIENLRDNSITRQRYWGAPVPIWRCDSCGKIEVFGSVEELEQRAGVKIREVHKPDIDSVTFKCSSCNGTMHRVRDVLDVWIDSGTTSWNALNFPKDKTLFEKLYPPEFIAEGKDQIRGWFNLLTIASMLAFRKPAFKTCYMHGFINDAYGRKMSKSLGNYITPEEVLSRFGVDAWRFYAITATRAGDDLNYNFEDVKVKLKTLQVLWNLHKYLLDLVKNYDVDVKLVERDVKELKLDVEEAFMLSKLHSTIEASTKFWNDYALELAPRLVEDLILTLSRSYLQAVREKIASGSKQERNAVFYVLYHSLIHILKLMAPVTPFITEKIWQGLKQEFSTSKDLNLESVHLADWPVPNKALIDKQLEAGFNIAEEVITACLALREKLKLSVRWPLKKLFVTLKNEEDVKILKPFAKLVKSRVNVKDVEINFDAELSVKQAENVELFPQGIVILDTEQSPELIAEGLAREISRRVQALRARAKLEKKQRIELEVNVNCEESLFKNLEAFKEFIASRTGCESIVLKNKQSISDALQYKQEFKIKNFDAQIGFNVKD